MGHKEQYQNNTFPIDAKLFRPNTTSSNNTYKAARARAQAVSVCICLYSILSQRICSLSFFD